MYSGARKQFLEKLIMVYRELVRDSVCLRNRDGFFVLLHRLCPKAQPKHLCMFESWCEEYDSLLETQDSIADLDQALGIYRENQAKPVLPVSQLQQLKDRFARLDVQCCGAVDLSAVAEDLELRSSAELAMY